MTKKKNNEVAVVKKTKQLPNVNPSFSAHNSMINMIERIAQDPNADVDKMVALLDMQERIWKQNAKMAFNVSFAKLSKDLPKIEKSKEVSFKDKVTGKSEVAYKHETLEDIDDVCKPLLKKHGFTISFESNVRDGGGMIVTGTLSHEEGHEKTTSMPLALDTSGGKNNIQAAGSTMTYGTRYVYRVLLGLIVIDQDNDGNIIEPTLDEAHLTHILALIEESKADTTLFCKHMKVENIEEIPDKLYIKAANDLKAKIKKLDEK